MKADVKIEPLSEATLNETIDLSRRLFPLEPPEYSPKVCFLASLAPEKYRGFFEGLGITQANYWVARTENGKVVGVAGLYSSKGDEAEAYWGGWGGVDENFRGQGIFSALAKFVVQKAKDDGKKFLRLYTSTHPNEADAQRFYDTHGFVITKREPLQIGDKTFEKLYRELKL